MGKNNIELRYSKDVDIFTIWNGTLSSHSVSQGDFIIDLDENDNFCGVEILDAKKNLGLTDSFINNLAEISVELDHRPGSVSMVFNPMNKEIIIPFSKK